MSYSSSYLVDPFIKCPYCKEKMRGRLEEVHPAFKDDYYALEIWCPDCCIWLIEKSKTMTGAHVQAINKLTKITKKAERKKQRFN